MLNPDVYRPLFPILESKIHLANCSQGALSTRTIQAIAEYEETLLQRGMDWDAWMGEVLRAKEAFASLIGASAGDIAVLSSVSDAVSSIASCLPIGGRSRVVTTVDEFPTIGHGWLAGARLGRGEVVFAEPDGGFLTPAVIAPYLHDNTAVLSVHFVSYYGAVLQDVEALAEVAHQHGALIFVDAYQGLGTLPLDVRAANIDFLACGSLKYLLGLPGIAFLYVRPALTEELEPSMTGWFGRINPFSFNLTELDYAAGARRFDMGTPPIPAAYAAVPGMELIQEVGVPEICRHVQEISRFVIDCALERGLEVASPLDVTRKGASTAIRVSASRSALVEAAMLRRGIIVSARADVIRFAPHFFTTRDDIAEAFAVLDVVLSEMDDYRGSPSLGG